MEDEIININEFNYSTDYKSFDNDNRYKWVPYYKYYYENITDNTILIKCDDDILYIDTDRFEEFINNIDDDVLYFPNIINNDVCAYFQQKFDIHNLFDYNINDNIIYEIGHSYPLTDWYRSFDKACQIHDLFLNDKDKFLLTNKDLINYGNRISINFFACNNIAVKKIFLHFLEHGNGDDETYFGGEGSRYLSSMNKINKINPNFLVVHFQFGPQDGNKLDILYLDKYNELLDKYKI